MVEWPEWWPWELELSAHLLKRMIDRQFTEVDLREMLEQATGYRADADDPRRWVIETRHADRAWEVVVEPSRPERVLIVVTAYVLD